MSYADAQLDLSSVSVACLAGANGAGKSALLDAMTWAIWEEARAASDELIRLGEREMWVDVRFEHEGQLYKIRRSRYKVSGKASAKPLTKGALDLQVLNEKATLEKVTAPVLTQAVSLPEKPGNGKSGRQPEERLGSWKSLNCSNVKETEQLICTILRMDYNTFVNSAYLKQGQADRFTTCLPSERKQILSEILALSYFDRLQDKCKEHARTLKQERETLEQLFLKLPDKETQLAALDEQSDLLQINVARVKEERAKQEEEIVTLSQKKAQLHFLKHKSETSQSQMREDQTDINGLTKQCDEMTARLNGLSELIAHRGEIEQEFKQYGEIRGKIETFEKHAFHLQELNGKKMEARSQLSDLRNRLELELNQAVETFQEVQGKLDKLRKATADATGTSESFSEYKGLIAQESEMAKEQEAFAQLSLRIGELQTQITEWRIRLEADISQKQGADAQLVVTLSEEYGLQDKKLELEGEGQLLDKQETERELIEEKGLTVKSAIESIGLKIDALRRKQREHQEKIDQLQAADDSTICPLCSSPIVDRAAVVTHYRQVIEESAKEIIDLENKQTDLLDERQSLRKQYAELTERLNKRKDLDKQIGQFNEKLAAIKRAQELKAKLQEELELLQSNLEREEFAQVERNSLKSLRQELVGLNFDPALYSNLQAQVRLKRSIEPRYYQLQRDLADLTKLEAELPELDKRIEEIKNLLLKESYGQEIQDTLQALEKQIGFLDYDRDRHDELKQKLEQLLPSMEKHRDLLRAQEERPQIECSLQNCQTMLQTKLAKIKSGQADLVVWEEELKQLPDIEAELARLTATANNNQVEYEKLSNEYAVFQAKREQLIVEIKELEKTKEALADVKQAFDDYSFWLRRLARKVFRLSSLRTPFPKLKQTLIDFLLV